MLELGKKTIIILRLNLRHLSDVLNTMRKRKKDWYLYITLKCKTTSLNSVKYQSKNIFNCYVFNNFIDKNKK